MAENTLQFELITPSGVVMQREIYSAIVPTEDGVIQVLPSHRELTSILASGELLIKDADGDEHPLAIAGGVVEVVDNRLRVLADTALPVSDIDMEAAQKRAEELAAELETVEKMDLTTYNQLQQQLAAEQAKLGVAKKWRG